jgi:glutathione S-transferase
MVGAVVAMRLHTGELPQHPALVAYNQRNQARPAFRAAQKINWPPDLFGGA